MWAGARAMGRSLVAGARGLTDPGARQRFWARTGEDWFALLSDMKGAAMKLGQFVSLYEDMLPAELIDALRRLQREATARPLGALQPVIDEAWGATERQRIVSVSDTAVAAASIGQVHRGQLDDGRAVAVKIRYPEVRGAVDDDIAALGRLFRMARIAPVDGRALDEVLAEIRTRFQQETDYRAELAHLQALRQDNAYAFVRFPEPVPALCSDAVLVTTWADGADLSAARQWPQATRDLLGERLARWVIAQVFDHGRLHADPHPGNFAFHDDGSFTVYDFGCVVPVRPEARAAMAQVVRGALRVDWQAVHAGLQALGAVPLGRTLRPQDERLYRRVVDSLLPALQRHRHFDFRDGQIIDDARRVARENLRAAFDYRPVPELVFVMRTYSGMYWMLRNLGARVRMRALLGAVARKAG